ncbi:hypothetical protein COLO4_17735 [Corchorus olitorius]|uniref:Uncharacterized protein n=1 Tax=Corchorus olitorius TaxID=93759 RepID=A0A1R3JBN9_9ROSI|nr:hypothetical protein COLO4_17735 [Corchorus olitorius]
MALCAGITKEGDKSGEENKKLRKKAIRAANDDTLQASPWRCCYYYPSYRWQQR